LGRTGAVAAGSPRSRSADDLPQGRQRLDTAALVDRMVDCFNRHDPEALAACYAPDARVHPAGWPQAVDTGTWLAAVPVILTTFPDLRLHPRNLATDDRVALLEARMTGTNTGPFPLSETERLLLGTQAETLPATGRATDITGVSYSRSPAAGSPPSGTTGRWPTASYSAACSGRPGTRSASTLPWSLSLRAFRKLARSASTRRAACPA
jgi:hypothetical protein